MAGYYQTINLPGFASWMRVQAQEELIHAMMFYTFLNERGGEVQLQPIAGPPTTWEAPAIPFAQAYEHETLVTARINNLVNLAIDERDHATRSFLDWFVNEQVEEEAAADAIVKQLKLIGDGGNGLFMIDRELGARVFAMPAAATAMGL
jgi:ferritin